MKTRKLNIEELEQRIAPEALGTPGTNESNGGGNSQGIGHPVDAGSNPQPAGP